MALLVAVVAPPKAAAEPARRPVAPRVIHVPTAHLQAHGRFFASAGSTHRGGPFGAVTFGLGGIAELDLQLAGNVGACVACSGGDPHADSIAMPSALFKIGVAEGRVASWQPAMALGFRKVIDDRSVDVDAEKQQVAAADMVLVLSKTLTQVELHAGVQLWDMRAQRNGATRFLHDQRLRERLRPFAGLEWTPSIYPLTTLLADFSFAPVVEPDTVELRWLAGWGVRYQALTWGSIELAVRHRDGDSLSDTTFMVRVNITDPRSQL